MHDLSAFEYEAIGGFSNDGKMISLNSFDVAGDTSYRLYLQHTNGSAPVLVGHGSAAGFSNDGNWLSAVDPTHPENLFIIPTGIGEARTLHAPAGRYYTGVAFFPDGKRILITTVASGQSPQSAVQDLETGSVHLIGPSGRYVVTQTTILFPGPSLDGKYCIEADAKRHYWLQPIEGEGAREISGIGADERIVNWQGDSKDVFVSHQDGAKVQISNLDLTSGQRRPWTTFSPQDKTGMTSNSVLLITPDGAHFAYEAHKMYSTLFVANGVR